MDSLMPQPSTSETTVSEHSYVPIDNYSFNPMHDFGQMRTHNEVHATTSTCSNSNNNADFRFPSYTRIATPSTSLLPSSTNVLASSFCTLGRMSPVSVNNSNIEAQASAFMHPFSIAALLGNTANMKCESDQPPAQITSSYSVQLNSCIPEAIDTGFTPPQSPPIVSPIALRMSSAPSDTTDIFWCHVCNALCLNRYDAQSHHCRHKLQEAKCLLQRSIFIRYGYVTKHQKVDEEKIKCGLCCKVVAQCFFTKHQRLHDGHFCDVCNHEFSTNSRLQDHMNVHTGNTPFTCIECDRKFAKRSSLTQHQRYHRDHQLFKCNHCRKSFNSKYTCKVHERLHTGENPYLCSVPGCLKAFPQKIQLQLHLNSHSQC